MDGSDDNPRGGDRVNVRVLSHVTAAPNVHPNSTSTKSAALRSGSERIEAAKRVNGDGKAPAPGSVR